MTDWRTAKYLKILQRFRFNWNSRHSYGRVNEYIARVKAWAWPCNKTVDEHKTKKFPIRTSLQSYCSRWTKRIWRPWSTSNAKILNQRDVILKDTYFSSLECRLESRASTLQNLDCSHVFLASAHISISMTALLHRHMPSPKLATTAPTEPWVSNDKKAPKQNSHFDGIKLREFYIAALTRWCSAPAQHAKGHFPWLTFLHHALIEPVWNWNAGWLHTPHALLLVRHHYNICQRMSTNKYPQCRK